MITCTSAFSLSHWAALPIRAVAPLEPPRVKYTSSPIVVAGAGVDRGAACSASLFVVGVVLDATAGALAIFGVDSAGVLVTVGVASAVVLVRFAADGAVGTTASAFGSAA